MILNKSDLHYFLVIALVVLLKLIYPYLDAGQLTFLLKPTSQIIELLFNTNPIFETNTGYYHPELNIEIDRSCSGFNFWMIVFLMITFLLLKHINEERKRLLTIPGLLIVTYFMTILVNSSRIVISLIIHNKTDSLFHFQPNWLHEAIGSFVYLFFLISIYLGTTILITKKTIVNENIS